MPQTSDYALLAADAYRDARKQDKNHSPVPLGWRVLTKAATKLFIDKCCSIHVPRYTNEVNDFAWRRFA
jgi:hypothetical protein